MTDSIHQLVAVLVVIAAPVPAVAKDPTIFDHREHLAEAKGFPKCGVCHTQQAKADTIRPGREGHATCDGAGCHADAFSPAAYGKTQVCTICHVKKTRLALPNNLKPFPPTKPALEYYAEFSHQSHLVARVKKNLKDACLDCHVVDTKTKEVARPGHDQCVSCHGENDEVPMSKCDACHRPRVDGEGRTVSTGPRGRPNPCRVTKHFSHAEHRVDRRAREADKPVSCGTCHFGLNNAKTLGAIVPTNARKTMLNACGKCHRPGQRTAQGKAVFTTTGDCTRCHQDACLTSGPIPSWHKE
ncbi:MAG: hypothetical protein H6730_15400 [Deltaproteobacteria bacterium]|nr:hypothetical protein [Deltaproteobacteria bacterium]